MDDEEPIYQATILLHQETSHQPSTANKIPKKSILVTRKTNKEISDDNLSVLYATTVPLNYVDGHENNDQEDHSVNGYKNAEDESFLSNGRPLKYSKNEGKNDFGTLRSMHFSNNPNKPRTISFKYEEEVDRSLANSNYGKLLPDAPKDAKVIEADEMASAAKIESIAGIIHLVVIVMSIAGICLMSKLSDRWNLARSRCPLYVKNIPDIDIYWGNENMAACNYAAFMPVLLILLSMTLMVLHGGILNTWRKHIVSPLFHSKRYPWVLGIMGVSEMLASMSVSCVLSDGLRQTCLSFQLTPFLDERPPHCKAGYDDRDDAYGLSNTYTKIVVSLALSWITTGLLGIISGLYLSRCKG